MGIYIPRSGSGGSITNVGSLNGLEGDITLNAGSNVTINVDGQTINISAASSGGSAGLEPFEEVNPSSGSSEVDISLDGNDMFVVVNGLQPNLTASLLLRFLDGITIHDGEDEYQYASSGIDSLGNTKSRTSLGADQILLHASGIAASADGAININMWLHDLTSTTRPIRIHHNLSFRYFSGEGVYMDGYAELIDPTKTADTLRFFFASRTIEGGKIRSYKLNSP